MKRIPEAELERVRAFVDLHTVVERYVDGWDRSKSNFSRGDYWACCPFHGETTPSFHVDDGKGRYKCFGCGASGDHFKFLTEKTGCSFPDAVAQLGGRAEPEPLSPEQLAADKADRAARRADQERKANSFRAEEIRRARRIMEAGGRVSGTEGEAYLRGRGLLPCPVRLPLRFLPHYQYWHQRDVAGQKKPEPYVLMSAPAMLAPITGPDGFQGVHITCIDPARPGKKMVIEDPEASGAFLPAKKIRGSKRAAAIRLWTPERFDRLVIGEGIETTLSVLVSELDTDRFARTAYWTSIDLQHMGGKAVESVPHQTAKDRSGRPRRVPGPVPDMDDADALQIPEHVREVLRLGDGDSCRFTSDQVMARSKARWARPGLTDCTVFAPEGQDFNDILAGAS
ncbi:CHC2 zinc finger domain-containing protein [Roseibium sp.]|uniref:CHC2 zinc finger domain-containing protein n=2 Tax=Roseibium sp. TaxID=1936156 RepID=UPI0032677A10